MDALTSLVLANVLFVGTHFLMSHPMRAGMVRTLGDKGFMGVYSLVSIALFVWIVMAFRAAEPGPLLWDGSGIAIWVIASLLTIIATALLLGSMKGNPALPEQSAEDVAKAQATGALAVTRHPMMWSVAIWALSHVIAWPSPRTLVTAGAMGVLALVGARLQDAKKEKLLGEAWAGWQAKTSYWTRLGKLGAIGLPLWLVAIVLWIAFTWLHVWLGGIPAGVWMWVG